MKRNRNRKNNIVENIDYSKITFLVAFENNKIEDLRLEKIKKKLYQVSYTNEFGIKTNFVGKISVKHEFGVEFIVTESNYPKLKYLEKERVGYFNKLPSDNVIELPEEEGTIEVEIIKPTAQPHTEDIMSTQNNQNQDINGVIDSVSNFDISKISPEDREKVVALATEYMDIFMNIADIQYKLTDGTLEDSVKNRLMELGKFFVEIGEKYASEEVKENTDKIVDNTIKFANKEVKDTSNTSTSEKGKDQGEDRNKTFDEFSKTMGEAKVKHITRVEVLEEVNNHAFKRGVPPRHMKPLTETPPKPRDEEESTLGSIAGVVGKGLVAGGILYLGYRAFKFISGD